MTELGYPTPSVGEKNTVVAPKVDTALANIKTWAAGQIDSTNIKPEGVNETALTSGLRALINTKASGLTVKSTSGAVSAESGYLYVMTATGTVTLPAVSAGVQVAVFAYSGEVTIKTTSAKIYGDFLTTPPEEIKLLTYQHVTLQSDGTRWLIIAGEPKREQTYSSTAAEQETASASFVSLGDEVTVTLPENGLVAIAYQATWQESVAEAGRAAIFLGANQLKVAMGQLVDKPENLEAKNNNGSANQWIPLYSFTGGICAAAQAVAASYTGDVTTGQIVGGFAGGGGGTSFVAGGAGSFAQAGVVGGGPCYVFAAAGTYKITVQFRSSSGTVKVKNRKLWAWVVT